VNTSTNKSQTHKAQHNQLAQANRTESRIKVVPKPHHTTIPQHSTTPHHITSQHSTPQHTTPHHTTAAKQHTTPPHHTTTPHYTTPHHTAHTTPQTQHRTTHNTVMTNLVFLRSSFMITHQNTKNTPKHTKTQNTNTQHQNTKTYKNTPKHKNASKTQFCFRPFFAPSGRISMIFLSEPA